MDKRDIWMRRAVAFGLVCVLCIFATAALAGQPYRQSISLTAGAGSASLTLGDYNAALKLTHIAWGTASGSTNTLSFVTGSVTNPMPAKTVSATDNVQYITNSLWLFKSYDSIVVSSTDTNAATAVIVGELP